MKNILLLSLFQANGGIASWSRKYIKTFQSDEFVLVPVDRSTGLAVDEGKNFLKRCWHGLQTLWKVQCAVKQTLRSQTIDLLHTTTSGGVMGTVRDYWVARICRKRKIPCIMHCRYGCITEDMECGVQGWFLRKTMAMYNEVWVLDNRSAQAMRHHPELASRVFVTPNSIDVPTEVVLSPKTYRQVAFVANLEPTKGLFQLVEGFKNMRSEAMELSIVGKGSPEVMKHLEEVVAGCSRIHLLGQLPNEQAVAFMKKVDILALPTYMAREAFPISILEAMSLGKLVLSTRRAAIGDMLTGLDGQPCGLFVREQSTEDITSALEWCLEHSAEADNLCARAYEKVYQCYRTEVIYQLYTEHYRNLIS